MTDTTRKCILVVEDEPSIADAISYALQTEGFVPLCATTGKQTIDHLSGNDSISLIILDVGLPDTNGFDLLKRIRALSDLPVIFLTARSGEIDRVVGLELGADDYVAKPFSPRELTARVRAVLRRTALPASDGPSTPQISESPFVIDKDRCSISYNGSLLELSRYEYRILSTLISKPGRVFTREQLLARISEDPDMSLQRTIDTHIKTIRQKLRQVTPDYDPISTHRGFGYSLKEFS